MSDPSWQAALQQAIERAHEQIGQLQPSAQVEQIGRVEALADGVARIDGLDHAVMGELLELGDHAGARVSARVEELDQAHARVVLLDRGELLAGAPARRVGRVLDVPSGPGLIGRVLDPLGRPLDERGPVVATVRRRIERPGVDLIDRDLVRHPLRTGVFAIDTMFPIGLGQRQLIVGDRATGKTELGIDILAALEPELIGIYVAIGRRASETAATLDQLRAAGLFEHGFAVVSSADDPLGLIHLSPYAATAMAESLVELGHDVVIVYDDLGNHAHAHRSLALLLGRPVGREAHPVDVFYAHARLLERACAIDPTRGGGSLTAFPLLETQAGDLTGYIPTNLVSITDGQLRLDAALVASGLVPAIDVGLSVSRVGGKAQPPLVRKLAGSFKNRYAQFLELESFARFGTRLEREAQGVVDWGRRVRAVLHQARRQPLSWAQTVARLLLIEHPALLEVPLADVATRVREAADQLVSDPRFDARNVTLAVPASRVAELTALVASRATDLLRVAPREGSRP